MTEQEYCDLSDLQLARACINILSTMNCFEEPNKEARINAIKYLRVITENLNDKVNIE